MFRPIMMTEEYWANSQFSVARHYGGLKIGTSSYLICDKRGITVFELSDKNSEYYVGDNEQKAIQPGEPVDLVRLDWLPIYRIVGREKMLEMAKNNVPLDVAIQLVTRKKYDAAMKTTVKHLPITYLQ